MNHVVSIDVNKRNESRQKQIDSFYKEILDAYISGGGNEEDAIKYIHDTYGVVYTKNKTK